MPPRHEVPGGRRSLGPWQVLVVLAALPCLLLGGILLLPPPIEGFRARGGPAPSAVDIPREPLVPRAQGAVVDGPEDLALAPDGSLVTGDRHGRILRIGADGDVTVRLLADTAGGRPLRFLNGLAVAADGTVLVTDSSARLHSTSLGPVLPGIPDNLSRSAERTILVGPYDRSPALDRLVLPTRMGREVVARLPADWFLVGGLSGSVLVNGEDGTVQGRFGDPGTAATEVLAHEGAWILGALGTTPLRRVEDPTNPSLSP